MPWIICLSLLLFSSAVASNTLEKQRNVSSENIQLPKVQQGEKIWPYTAQHNGEPMPFELSEAYLDPNNGPTIPNCDTRDGKEYDKSVAIGWSGENDWAQFLNALGTLSQQLSPSSEVHIFANNPPAPAASASSEDYNKYLANNDFERAKRNPNIYPEFSNLSEKTNRHNADSASLIKLLEGLYKEAISGKKIHVTMMISNHGAFVIDGREFKMNGSNDTYINEKEMAYIGRLLAPMDSTIVNGTCYGADHVDLIQQNMAQHRDYLIKSQGMVELENSCSCAVTRALFGRPAFGSKTALEGDIFSKNNAGKSLQDSLLNTSKSEVAGFAKMGYSDDWSSNLPLTTSDKLAYYMRVVHANRDINDGIINKKNISGAALTSGYINEADPNLLAEQFKTTFTDLEKISHMPELKGAILEGQRAVESVVRELGLSELINFSFEDSAKGTQYMQAIIANLKKGPRAGMNDNFEGSEIEKLLSFRSRLQVLATDLAKNKLYNNGRPTSRLMMGSPGVIFSIEPNLKTYKDPLQSNREFPVKYIPDALKEVEEKIEKLTEGNDEHKWKYAAALISRQLTLFRSLTKKINENGKPTRVQQLFASYKNCELLNIVPDSPMSTENSKIRKGSTHKIDRIVQSTSKIKNVDNTN